MSGEDDKKKPTLFRKPRPPKKKKFKPPIKREASLDLFCPDDVESIYTTSDDEDGVQKPYTTPISNSQTNMLSRPPSNIQHIDDHLLSVKKSITKSTKSKASKIPAVEKWQKRYMLDPLYDSRQTTAVNDMRRNLMKSFKPKGPDALVARPPKQNLCSIANFLAEDDDIRYYKPPLFTLNNFMLKMSEQHRMPVDRIRKAMLSTANFKHITEVVARCLHAHEEQPDLKYVDVDLDALEEIEDARNRVPSHQVLLEMTALVKQRISELAQTEVICAIKHLPHYDPKYRIGEAPHTEIIVYEKDKKQELNRFIQFEPQYQHLTTDALVSTGGARAFQNATRGSSPFTLEDQVSPSEVAILDCMMSGGIALSLKANFIQSMPDISMLLCTLTYVNLSYNNFREFPVELFHISNLQILKLRNNPLIQIPNQIDQLPQLESLILSFCLISNVPVSVYNLRKLRVLDLSYNKLSFLHSEIRYLRDLSILNVEGNELTSLPCGLLRLRLKKLRVKNNFLHPLLWKENMKNSPQHLTDICALTLSKLDLSDIQNSIPDETRNLLTRFERCDCCKEVRFGSGLRIIRPASKIFGVRMLPILFRSCSPTCRDTFLESTESIAKILYNGDSDMDEDREY